MNNVKKWLFGLVISIMALCSLALIPSEETFASSTCTVYFNYDFNNDQLSTNLSESIREKYSGIKSVKVDVGNTVEKPNIDIDISGYYNIVWKILAIDTYVDYNFNTPVTSNITLVAEWTPVNYTIYFVYPSDIRNEIVNSRDSQTYNFESTQIELYRPQRPNYVFVNWYRDSKLSQLCLNIPAHSTSDFTLYPKWRPIDYNINYHTEGENLYNITSFNVKTEDFILRAPTRTGYSFLGWYLDEDCTYECTKITNSMLGDLDLYAKWEAIVYNVTYILPDGTSQVVKCKYGETADLPEINKSIFEVIKTSSSRDNITEDTIILISKNNIWYVYLIALIIILAIVGVCVFYSVRRTKTIKKLRYMYQSNYKKI